MIGEILAADRVRKMDDALKKAAGLHVSDEIQPVSIHAARCFAPPKFPDHALRETMMSPMTRRSIRVRRKQSSASSGVHTTGSFSFNDVLSTIGTPVRSRKASIRR